MLWKATHKDLYIRRLLTILLFFLSVQGAKGQEEFITPSRFLTRFSFEPLVGGVVLIHGRFDAFPDTLNFILDTGSGGISLDSLTAEYFGLKPEPSDKTIRGIAGIKKVNFINNKTLHLPGLTVDNLNFHVNNYDILTSVYGIRIDGIIGYSVLNRYILKINYDSSYLEFWTRGTINYPRGGFLLRPVINALPVQMARVRDAHSFNARFLYDMGAGLNLMLSKDFVTDSAILNKKRKLYVKEAEGLGGKVDMQLTVIREFRLGPYKFRNVPTFVFDDVYNVTSYPYLCGLIGNDLLRRFNIIMNYEKRDIYLMPNSHYNDVFDYSYSGLELYYVNGKVIVGDVAAQSPAAQAGIKEGDQVISINNLFNQSLQQYKLAIQTQGQKLNFIVMRNGVLLTFHFKVGTILK